RFGIASSTGGGCGRAGWFRGHHPRARTGKAGKRQSWPEFWLGPPGRNPVGAQRDQAADVFAFDTLIQNPDRRAVNPNLWARSDRLGVYDHEQAFSFLSVPIIGGTPKPWVAASHGNGFRFLEQHVFYRNLRGGRLDLGPFKEKLGALTDKR